MGNPTLSLESYTPDVVEEETEEDLEDDINDNSGILKEKDEDNSIGGLRDEEEKPFSRVASLPADFIRLHAIW